MQMFHNLRVRFLELDHNFPAAFTCLSAPTQLKSVTESPLQVPQKSVNHHFIKLRCAGAETCRTVVLEMHHGMTFSYHT